MLCVRVYVRLVTNRSPVPQEIATGAQITDWRRHSFAAIDLFNHSAAAVLRVGRAEEAYV